MPKHVRVCSTHRPAWNSRKVQTYFVLSQAIATRFCFPNWR